MKTFTRNQKQKLIIIEIQSYLSIEKNLNIAYDSIQFCEFESEKYFLLNTRINILEEKLKDNFEKALLGYGLERDQLICLIDEYSETKQITL